jgi:hypothetical protein
MSAAIVLKAVSLVFESDEEAGDMEEGIIEEQWQKVNHCKASTVIHHTSFCSRRFSLAP